MDESTVNEVLRAYERLEETLLNFGEQVLFTEENEVIQTPSLAGVIMDACGILDSFFRWYIPDPFVMNGVTKNREDCKIPEFAGHFSSRLDLPNTQSMMLISPPRLRNPFNAWKDLNYPTNYPPLPWWQAYNDLKHDRLAHLKKATLSVALDSLCALHQVISRIAELEVFELLLRRNWITIFPYNIYEVRTRLQNKQTLRPIIVQTKLFAVPVGSNPHGEGNFQFASASDLKSIPVNLITCKQEFRDFLGFA